MADKLSMTSYGILGLLTFGAKSGYDLTKQAERTIGYFWTPAKSQIYSELRRLADTGHVREKLVAQETRPDKRIYSLTPRGRAALEEWLADPDFAPDSIRSVNLLKVFFGAHAPRDVLISRIKELAAHSETTLAYLRSVEDEIKGQADLLFPYLTVRSGLLHSQATIRWAKEVLGLIEDGDDGKEGS